MDEEEVKSNPQHQSGGQTMKVNAKSALGMGVGQFAKEGSRKDICEDPECGKEMDVAFHVMVRDGNRMEERKYCEESYRKFWLKQGIIRQ